MYLHMCTVEGDKNKDTEVNTGTCVSKVNLYHSGSIVRLQKGPNDSALVWSFVISHTHTYNRKHTEPRSLKNPSCQKQEVKYGMVLNEDYSNNDTVDNSQQQICSSSRAEVQFTGTTTRGSHSTKLHPQTSRWLKEQHAVRLSLHHSWFFSDSQSTCQYLTS